MRLQEMQSKYKKEKTVEKYDPNKCPECGSKELEHDSEGKYCKKCGFLIE
jgi:ribosomal protein L37AE/L43A